MNETDLIFITEEEAGKRLDRILAERFSEQHSRSYFQYLIREHLVSVNGTPVKKHTRLDAGDEVEIHFLLTPQMDVRPEKIPLDILYEDEFLLAVNKPAGMVVHPAPGNWSNTFVNAFLYHCREVSADPENVRPGIVHRLDKETSGVLVAAKTPKVQQDLVDQFAERKVKKRYLAVCLGNPGEGQIDRAIGRHPVKRKEMEVKEEGGRSAVSDIKTLAFDGKLSIVEIKPLTGRTHQIRVHLKYRGAAVLGDKVYGNLQQNKRYKADRHLLHAESLTLTHPKTKETLALHAPIPGDMEIWFKKIGRQKNENGDSKGA